MPLTSARLPILYNFRKCDEAPSDSRLAVFCFMLKVIRTAPRTLRAILGHSGALPGKSKGRTCCFRPTCYQITLIGDGGVVLDIFPDDHPKHKFFDPTEEADPIIQAMRYAEGYDAEH
jgi:hypothetical protein